MNEDSFISLTRLKVIILLLQRFLRIVRLPTHIGNTGSIFTHTYILPDKAQESLLVWCVSSSRYSGVSRIQRNFPCFQVFPRKHGPSRLGIALFVPLFEGLYLHPPVSRQVRMRGIWSLVGHDWTNRTLLRDKVALLFTLSVSRYVNLRILFN